MRHLGLNIAPGTEVNIAVSPILTTTTDAVKQRAQMTEGASLKTKSNWHIGLTILP